MNLSIVIVNYRGWKRLRQCLESIRSLGQVRFNFEVIVVDNQSGDNQLAVFKSDFKEFTFIENTGNNGFANGCNLGAQHSRGSLLLFLNPDTVVSTNAIEALVETAELHPEIYILSCQQMNERGKGTTPYGLFPKISTLTGFLRAIYRLTHKRLPSKILKNNLKAIFPDWVSGSVILISQLKFSEIGKWNEDYWMYYEDVDLCKRVKNSGGEVALITDINIEHNHGGASRLNIDIKSLTKSEAINSKHVYINNHFRGIEALVLQSYMVLENIFVAFTFSLLALVTFFSIAKINLYFKVYSRIARYYLNAFRNKTWLSTRSKKFRPKV